VVYQYQPLSNMIGLDRMLPHDYILSSAVIHSHVLQSTAHEQILASINLRHVRDVYILAPQAVFGRGQVIGHVTE
jgi:hypothetical protein